MYSNEEQATFRLYALRVFESSTHTRYMGSDSMDQYLLKCLWNKIFLSQKENDKELPLFNVLLINKQHILKMKFTLKENIYTSIYRTNYRLTAAPLLKFASNRRHHLFSLRRRHLWAIFIIYQLTNCCRT